MPFHKVERPGRFSVGDKIMIDGKTVYVTGVKMGGVIVLGRWAWIRHKLAEAKLWLLERIGLV